MILFWCKVSNSQGREIKASKQVSSKRSSICARCSPVATARELCCVLSAAWWGGVRARRETYIPWLSALVKGWMRERSGYELHVVPSRVPGAVCPARVRDV